MATLPSLLLALKLGHGGLVGAQGYTKRLGRGGFSCRCKSFVVDLPSKRYSVSKGILWILDCATKLRW